MRLHVSQVDLAALRSALIQAACAAPLEPSEYHSPRGFFLEVLDRIDVQLDPFTAAQDRLSRLASGASYPEVYRDAYNADGAAYDRILEEARRHPVVTRRKRRSGT